MSKYQEMKTKWFKESVRQIMDKGFNQGDICEKLGVNRQHFNQVYKNNKNVSDNMLEELCSIFELPMPLLLSPLEVEKQRSHECSESSSENAIQAKPTKPDMKECRQCPIFKNFIEKIENYAAENAVLKTKLELMSENDC